MTPESGGKPRITQTSSSGLPAVELSFDSTRQFAQEYSSYLSHDGLFIRTDEPQPPSTVLRFRVRLPGDFVLIEGNGVVEWARSPGDHGTAPAGMAVRFISLAGQSKEVIEQLVARHIEQTGRCFSLESPLEDQPAVGAPARAAEPPRAPRSRRQPVPPESQQQQQRRQLKLTVRGVAPAGDETGPQTYTASMAGEAASGPTLGDEPYPGGDLGAEHGLGGVAAGPASASPEEPAAPEPEAMQLSLELDDDEEGAWIDPGSVTRSFGSVEPQPQPSTFSESPSGLPEIDLDPSSVPEWESTPEPSFDSAAAAQAADSPPAPDHYADTATMDYSPEPGGGLSFEPPEAGEAAPSSFGTFSSQDEPAGGLAADLEPSGVPSFDPGTGGDGFQAEHEVPIFSTEESFRPEVHQEPESAGPSDYFAAAEPAGQPIGQSFEQQAEEVPAPVLEETAGPGPGSAGLGGYGLDAQEGLAAGQELPEIGSSFAGSGSLGDVGSFGAPSSLAGGGSFDAPATGGIGLSEGTEPGIGRGLGSVPGEAAGSGDSLGPSPGGSLLPDADELPMEPLPRRRVETSWKPPTIVLSGEAEEEDVDVTQRLEGISPDAALGFDELSQRGSKPKRRSPMLLIVALILVAVATGAYLARDQISALLPFVGGGEDQQVADLLEPADRGPFSAVDGSAQGESEPEQTAGGLFDDSEPDQAEPGAQAPDEVVSEDGDDQGPAGSSFANGGQSAEPETSVEPYGATTDAAGRGGPAEPLTPVSKVLDIAWSQGGAGTTITITGDGAFSTDSYGFLALESPPRILIRLNRIFEGYPRHELDARTSEISGIRVGYHPENRPPQLFIVLDLTDDLVRVTGAEADGRQLRISVAR